MLQKEPEDVQKALKREAAEELKVMKEKHKEAKKGLPSALGKSEFFLFNLEYLLTK